jgi:two-component system LytT family response regulator
MVRCIIVEDDKISQELLIKKLAVSYPECEVVELFENKIDAVHFLNNNTIDLVFLDVNLKEGSGMDVLEEVEKRTFETIFITAHDNFAISALNQNASYYILKPIIDSEFKKGMTLVIDKIRQSKSPSKILIPNKGVYLPINLVDILYFESDGAYTYVVTSEDRVLSSKNIGYYEKNLPVDLFKRPHHSYIVNIDKIHMFKKGRSGILIMQNDKEIPVSQRKMNDFLDYFIE